LPSASDGGARPSHLRAGKTPSTIPSGAFFFDVTEMKLCRHAAKVVSLADCGFPFFQAARNRNIHPLANPARDERA
jgi:hypothetical protein